MMQQRGDASLREATAGSRPRSDGSGKPFKGARVLIVDDAGDAADSLARLLRIRGAETECAYTGSEGVEKARVWKPGVAVVDIALPDLSGFEVARRIRAQDDGDGVLLLAVTGFGDGRTERDALEAGFDERIVKPIDLERLYGQIARLLDGSTEG